LSHAAGGLKVVVAHLQSPVPSRGDNLLKLHS
jgi:hypothetical protein